MQKSFNQLLEQYKFLENLIAEQTTLIKELSETPRYKEKVEILRTIPGVGILVAMEMLLELQDVSRFQKADQLAAYVGLLKGELEQMFRDWHPGFRVEGAKIFKVAFLGSSVLHAL